MARVYASALFKANRTWYVEFPSLPAIQLRKGGFYAGHETIEGLQAECKRLFQNVAKKRIDDVDLDVTFVDDYYILDSEDSFVTLLRVPMYPSNATEKFYFRGRADGHEVMRAFSTWKVDFGAFPKVSVRTLEKNWTELGKPNKIYASSIARSFLITLNVLNYANNNPFASWRTVWENAAEVCSFSTEKPTMEDMVENMAVLEALVSLHPVLERSTVVQSTLERGGIRRRKRKLSMNEAENVDPQELGDAICSICDDGGDLICCDGPCMRSFHATEAAGVSSSCESLDLHEDVVRSGEPFYCKNCVEKLHQCYECGKLGRSEGPDQEVFLCAVAFCGRFYHLSCGASVKGFSCPQHSCYECGGQDKLEKAMWLYPCRRCPRAWHRSCLDPRIKFDDDEEAAGQLRGWHVGKAKFVYCMRHEICPDINSPLRNVVFPVLGRREEVPEAEPPIRIKRKCGGSDFTN